MKVLALKLDLKADDYRPYLPLLCRERENRIGDLRQPADRLRSVCGELLVRKTIADLLHIENQEIDFSTNQYGKPYLSFAPDFHFNISHSGCWVVGAFANVPVGIDVEHVQRTLDLAVAAMVLSPEEFVHYQQLEHEAAVDYFFRIWTLKESFVKAVGKGLSIEPSSLTIRKAGDALLECLADGRRSSGRFREYELEPNYRTAVCALGETVLPHAPECVTITYFEQLLV
ncbi:4'-phosphopantetheinyl transferase superfamily protein [Sporomusa sp. GT1]|jgi:4'-phosphopantetheinyl transferase|uniref:4'-phosphopantetheinyl transferase family protein n=1 Tax=Sporomusa sp. GT1 TaxID=1534747 RepID=UPI00166CC516|nr:4'-phosphopantetheinyl transferase superfamily protein [Sporomusa sp. GT1]